MAWKNLRSVKHRRQEVTFEQLVPTPESRAESVNGGRLCGLKKSLLPVTSAQHVAVDDSLRRLSSKISW